MRKLYVRARASGFLQRALYVRARASIRTLLCARPATHSTAKPGTGHERRGGRNPSSSREAAASDKKALPRCCCAATQLLYTACQLMPGTNAVRAGGEGSCAGCGGSGDANKAA
uniref:Uncharacterized protein n=1 Tax=Chrysotila carterae TaxID=13221 RepID=A0A6T0CWX0_CHRCT|mmetsp:Transcript_15188/g.29651  ORF Transcript_15188/g.29651 Transcript_15188/m.29651 type:complete len:114 (+) Transcript_15188:324-665(+)|eukprot:1607940-Pleurochrysis_carterae.AAC.1